MIRLFSLADVRLLRESVPWYVRSVGLSLLLLAVLSSNASAVIVIEKGKDEPIYGYLIDANDVRVILAIPTVDGGTRERILPRASIEFMRETVSKERLSSLQPDDPRSYRDYADDLSEKRQDPDARQTATRLYLIAAHLDPENLGRGCLLASADLALNDAQRRKYRAMVYLLDPTHDRSVLDATATPSHTKVDLLDSERDVLRRGLRAIRDGRKDAAKNFTDKSDFRAALSKFPAYLTVEQYVAAADDPYPELSEDLLRQVVALELEIEGYRASPTPAVPTTGSWSRVQLMPPESVTELSLEAIAPFDPRKSVYREGKWVEPESE